MLASNNDERLFTVVEELGLSSYFDRVLVASHLGWKKPSPRFYLQIAKELRLDPVSLVHVGNDLNLDIGPALNLGWRAILLLGSAEAIVEKHYRFEKARCFGELKEFLSEKFQN